MNNNNICNAKLSPVPVIIISIAESKKQQKNLRSLRDNVNLYRSTKKLIRIATIIRLWFPI